jgi:branched-subunit amino acid permease
VCNERALRQSVTEAILPKCNYRTQTEIYGQTTWTLSCIGVASSILKQTPKFSFLIPPTIRVVGCVLTSSMDSRWCYNLKTRNPAP